MILVHFAAWGDDEFNPANPAEPGTPPAKLTVKVEPSNGGSAYGAGSYVPGTTIGMRVSANSGFVFDKWTDENGNVISSTGSFNFVKGTGAEELTAHFIFAPDSPSEPAEPSTIQYFRLTLAAESGGTVSGGGKYLAGKTVTVNANCSTGYDFVNWTNSAGEVVSSSISFSYVTTAENETLTAHFVFNPDSPNEPSDPVLRHNIVVSTEDGGTVNVSNNRILEGTSTMLWATANDGYVFVGWYLNGELYTTLPEFSYTMGDENVHFEAVFEFSPASPGEPSMPETGKYAFTMMTVIGKPGDTLSVPVYLTNLEALSDMTFQLTFSPEFMPDMKEIYISEKAEGYSVSFTATSDTTYVVSMIGGTVPAGNTNLFTFKVKVSEDIETGSAKQVKINQVSVTEADGTALTASTRNGLIAIYKKGDTNGDNTVNVTDAMNLVLHILEQETEVFIKEVSDLNDDTEFNVTDTMGIVNIVFNEEN